VKQVRAQGRIPAVIYGRQAPAQPLEILELDLKRMIHHSVTENILIDLEVSGDARPRRLALLQEAQHHPLSGNILHVDLHEVAEDEKVIVSVPVEALGESVGVKGGGILEHIMFKVKVRALPRDLPEIIEVDVSHLDINQSLHLGDIPTPPRCELVGDKKLVVLSIAAPVTEAEEAAAAAAEGEAPAEPEVLREKKGEEEEGAEAGGKTAAAGKAPAAGAKGAAPADAKAPAGGAKGAEKSTAKGAEKAPAKGADKKK